ncbi:MAG: ATP synthase F1 subunit epsilon [Bdellovibrio sp. CG10_big_fil_rev_8_21_14_0_10_47_8]|nr:MAG: ATP synthase F1 subunit epsilon [Bdellovibrio sp. CG10_big_fil_rev_8_21_14_0_10_47_8]
MFKLNFATPDKKVVTDMELEEITLPAFSGELNVLPGHSPLMTTLEAGILKYRLKNGQTDKVAISWGYCQISTEAVNVLAETAVHADEIEVKVVEEHLKQFENKLATESLDEVDWEKTRHEIGRLKAEIDLVGENKKH